MSTFLTISLKKSGHLSHPLEKGLMGHPELSGRLPSADFSFFPIIVEEKKAAGDFVLVSYILAALIVVTVMYALAELAAAIPSACRCRMLSRSFCAT